MIKSSIHLSDEEKLWISWDVYLKQLKKFLPQFGSCVTACPCYEHGKWYDHGESFTSNCIEKTCQDGKFTVQEATTCTGVCLLTGSSMKLKPFDTTSLSDNSIEGTCEYNAFNVPEEGIKVTFKAVLCGTSGKRFT